MRSYVHYAPTWFDTENCPLMLSGRLCLIQFTIGTILLLCTMMTGSGRHISHDEIVRMRDLVRGYTPQVEKHHPEDPPGLALAWDSTLALFDRLVTNRNSVSAGWVRAIRRTSTEYQEHRLNNGQDRFAKLRAITDAFLDQLAEEQPEEPAQTLTPVTHLPLGVRIRDRRKAAGLTQKELAHRTGRSLMTVNRLENDQGREPSLETRRRLARELGGNPSDYTRD
jgi:DNA-binding XRE family transcriptional regulator